MRSAVTNCILAILLALQLSACDRKPPPINPTGPDGVQDNQLMTREAFEQTVLTNGPLAFISISASWCGSCRRAAPEIEAAAEEFKGRVVFGRLDFDEEKELAKRYEVTGVPTLLVFKGGKLVDKYEGPPTHEDIRKILKPHLEQPSTKAPSPVD